MTPYMKDALERVIATFVVAFLGALGVTLAAGQLPDKAALVSAAIAGAAAVVDVVKVIAAKFVGDRQSASFVE